MDGCVVVVVVVAVVERYGTLGVVDIDTWVWV